VKLALDFFDANVVDTGFSASHQPVFVKLPQLISVSTEPLTGCVVIFVLEANGDTVGRETPE